MVSREGISECLKHTDLKFYLIVKLKAEGETEFPHSISAEICADIFTEDLSDDVYAQYAAIVQGFTPHATRSYCVRGLLLTHNNLIPSNPFKYIHHTSRGVLEASAFFSNILINLHGFYSFLCSIIHL